MVIQQRMSMHTKDNSDLGPNTMAEGWSPYAFLRPAHCLADLSVFYMKTSPAIKKCIVCEFKNKTSPDFHMREEK